MDLTIIAGPLIGAVIGYFTNYLAVKMLSVREEKSRSAAKHCPSHRESSRKESRGWHG